MVYRSFFYKRLILFKPRWQTNKLGTWNKLAVQKFCQSMQNFTGHFHLQNDGKSKWQLSSQRFEITILLLQDTTHNYSVNVWSETANEERNTTWYLQTPIVIHLLAYVRTEGEKRSKNHGHRFIRYTSVFFFVRNINCRTGNKLISEGNAC